MWRSSLLDAVGFMVLPRSQPQGENPHVARFPARQFVRGGCLDVEKIERRGLWAGH